jgi:5-methylthioadenosine/S-adenosylhomocysteine deaminase
VRRRAFRIPLGGLLAALAALTCATPSLTQERRSVSLIVTGGIVVTVDAERRILSPGAVAIDGTSIVAVDRADQIAARFQGAQVIDASGRVVLPGLINTHTHAPMVLYRGLADDLALMEWLQKYIFPAEAKTVSPEFVRAGTRLAALEMIESGTTTYADMTTEEEIAKALAACAACSQTIIQFPVADAKTPADELTRTEAFIKAWRNDDLIVPAVAPHAMYTLDEASLKASRALADRYGVPVLIHLAETRGVVDASRKDHGLSPTECLESLGLWGPRTVAAHTVDVGRGHRHSGAAGIGASHNPRAT